MLLAVCCRNAALGIEGRLLCAGVMRAAPAFTLHHAIHSILLEVRCRLATRDIEAGMFGAGVV